MKPLGKGWSDKVIVENNKKRLFKKLLSVGGSHVLVLPKFWLELACKADSDGNYWIEASADVNQMVIKGVKELPQ